MTDPIRKPACPRPALLFDLADGSLDQDASDALRRHIDECAACRRLAQKAQRIHTAAVGLREPPVDEAMSQTIWDSLAPAVSRAARRLSRRNAWRILTAGPWPRLAAVASLLLVLGVGAGLLFRWLSPGIPTSKLHSDLPNHGAISTPPRTRGSASDVAASNRSRSASPVHNGLSTKRLRGVDPAPATVARKHEPPPRQVASRVPTAWVPIPGARARISSGAHGARLACGARILHRRGRLSLTQNSRDVASIRLDVGEVSLQVPKLKPNQRVEVVTPDARVKVHGTRFTVRSNGNGTTSVSVQDGVVWIHPTGRHRKTVVLGPGGHQTVQGETAYLASLLKQMQVAVRATDTHQAVRLGRRYLSVTSKPQQRAAAVRLLLAGALERLGQRAAAIAQYEKIVRGGGGAVARQNALAYLARLYYRSAMKTKALQTWRRLLKLFPKGIHSREALLTLVRAGCHSKDASVSRYGEQLARRFPGDQIVAATLKRCRPPAP